MALDASIIFQAGKGVTPLLSPAEIQEQRTQREIDAMKLQQARQAISDDNSLRQAYSAGGDIGQTLQQKGLYKPAMEYQKFQGEQLKSKLDQRKTEVETGSKLMEAMGGPLKYLADNPSLDNAAAVFMHLNSANLMTAEQIRSAKQQIEADPTPEGIRRFAMLGVQAAINAEKQATLESQRRGQDITMRGQDMSQSTALRGQDLSRDTSIRGQDMADTRARDLNATKAEEARIKREAKDDTANLTRASQIASFDTMLGTLERLSKHPGLARSVGLVGALPTVPGSDSANFQAELNTFQSQAFLPMVAQLKGMGALSDAEGKKLTAAVGALDPKMGEKAFRDSVARITADMDAARKRMVGGNATAKPPTTRTVDVGGTQMQARQAPDGKFYVQQGGKWFEVKE